MIVYQLRCSNGHEFEAWFRDGATYDDQAKAGDVNCPHCGDAHVCKAVMAPNIAPSRSRAAGPPDEAETITPPLPPAALDTSDTRAEKRAREVAEEILEAVGSIRTEIEENCEDVGDNFAEEAKRIHYGESEERGIYGSATDDEAEELTEEGVEFYRLPSTRRDS